MQPLMDAALVVRPSRTAICTNALSKQVQLTADNLTQSDGATDKVGGVSQSGQDRLEISIPSLRAEQQEEPVRTFERLEEISFVLAMAELVF